MISLYLLLFFGTSLDLLIILALNNSFVNKSNIPFLHFE